MLLEPEGVSFVINISVFPWNCSVSDACSFSFLRICLNYKVVCWTNRLPVVNLPPVIFIWGSLLLVLEKGVNNHHTNCDFTVYFLPYTFLSACVSILFNCSTDGNHSISFILFLWSFSRSTFVSQGEGGRGIGWTEGGMKTDQSCSTQNVLRVIVMCWWSLNYNFF